MAEEEPPRVQEEVKKEGGVKEGKSLLTQAFHT
jgi:hypothetical protein